MLFNDTNLQNTNYFVSWFDNIKFVTQSQIDIIDGFLIPVREQKYKSLIDKIRILTEKKERDQLKSDSLPGITTSGTYNQSHRAKDIINHSGLIQIDVDAGDNNADHLKAFKRDIINDPYCFAGFISPSGDGYKVIVKIPAAIESHLSCFTALKLYFIENYHINIDEKCKDLSRFMFISSDPDCFINRESEVFVPENHTYAKLKKWADKEYSFVKGSRNQYIMQLASACHRFGLSKDYLVQRLVSDFVQPDFTAIEIEKTIESIYRNTSFFNKVNTDKSQLPKPKSKGNAQIIVPPFPVEVFPDFLRALIDETNRVYNFHKDFTASSLLVATSLGIGNTYRVRAKYVSTASLYIVLIQRKGTGKSHPISMALKPFMEIDKVELKKYREAKKEYEIALKSKDGDKDGNLQKPIYKQLILSDFTIEALTEVHNFNPRGIAVYCDEIMQWINNFNRYNKGSENEFWLSNFNSTEAKNNRKGADPVFISEPFINVIGSLQTGLIEDFSKDSRTKNGFLDRILFAFPDDFKKAYYSDDILDPYFPEHYGKYIKKLVDLPLEFLENESINCKILSLSPEAQQQMKIWYNHNVDLMNDLNTTEFLRGVYSKLEIYLARLALILQMSYWACDEDGKEKIGLKAINGAIKIIEYFRTTAMKVYSHLDQRIISDKDLALTLKNLDVPVTQIAEIMKKSRQGVYNYF